ncbi:MAG: hypothetical protein ACOYK6_04130 [Chthoniobacterales bacterium]
MKASRIASLSEVAQRTNEGHEFGHCLADFLDGFYPEPHKAAIDEEPEKISPYYDSYLAAVADDCCRRYRWLLPRWCIKEERFLKVPFFAAKTHNLRMLYLMDSPAAFRERNIFVSPNALSRV